MKKMVVNINGHLIDFDKLPCAKCDNHYGYHCPKPDCWNKDAKYNVYGGDEIDDTNEIKIEEK